LKEDEEKYKENARRSLSLLSSGSSKDRMISYIMER